ncbi:MAG TPA: hypothetical protein VIJ17_07470, partial [Pseudolabrys sp.]
MRDFRAAAFLLAQRDDETTASESTGSLESKRDNDSNDDQQAKPRPARFKPPILPESRCQHRCAA